MNVVHIDATEPYNVHIGKGLLSSLGTEAVKLCQPGKAVVVFGENVSEIYSGNVISSLENAGFKVATFVHKDGEQAKDLATYGELQGFLCRNHMNRDDVIFALGGGVTGDLAGFSAATYLRGISYFQIPTTLLSMVDSSIGGKTGINLPEGKNQIGCFHQPKAVFCDTDVLGTLPTEEYRSGMAEIIKYGIIGDEEFFSFLERGSIEGSEEYAVTKCAEMKGNFVRDDEYDTGVRRMLNLGHTIGHAIEKCSVYTYRHGDAVSAGIASVSRSAAKFGLLSEEDCRRITCILEKYHLPVDCPFGREEIAEACLSDKKFSRDKLSLIVPRKIGKCDIIRIDASELVSWVN